MSWILCETRMPDRKEPVLYRRPDPRRPGKHHVGIAYWSVSETWVPAAESSANPLGFTAWSPIPDVKDVEQL